MVDRSLRGGDSGDWDPVGAAGHVVEPRCVKELDGVWVAAVFTADAEFQAWVGLAPDPGGEPHEPSDAGFIDRFERAAVDDLAVDVDGHER